MNANFQIVFWIIISLSLVIGCSSTDRGGTDDSNGNQNLDDDDDDNDNNDNNDDNDIDTSDDDDDDDDDDDNDNDDDDNDNNDDDNDNNDDDNDNNDDNNDNNDDNNDNNDDDNDNNDDNNNIDSDTGDTDGNCTPTAKWGSSWTEASVGTAVPNLLMSGIFDQNGDGQIGEAEMTPVDFSFEDIYCSSDERVSSVVVIFSDTG